VCAEVNLSFSLREKKVGFSQRAFTFMLSSLSAASFESSTAAKIIGNSFHCTHWGFHQVPVIARSSPIDSCRVGTQPSSTLIS